MSGGLTVAVRHRLLVRLLAGALVIAAASIAATAWLATRTTTDAIRRAESRSVSIDARVYSAVDGYAATHRDWTAIAPLLTRLGHATDRKIVLTARDRRPLSGAPAPGTQLPTVAAAVVDPLQVDALQLPGSQSSGIDPRALGPFRLSPARRRELTRGAQTVAACAGQHAGPIAPEVQDNPAGRPRVSMPVPAELSRKIFQGCRAAALLRPTHQESAALRTLNHTANRCLARGGQGPVRITLALNYNTVRAGARSCVLAARRSLLRPWVAPTALLFIMSPTGATGPLALSGGNGGRVALVAALVLGLAIGLAALLAMRLTRPLRRLSDAVSTGDETPLPVSSRDEIGQLTGAFNALSARRRQLEGQRRDMVRDIAHELRGPISNMRSWLEATEDGLVARDEALCTSLLDETLQLQHIVADLADLAAADAGTLALHPEPVALAELAELTAAGHRAAADAAGVRLRLAPCGDPTALADPVRVRQALGNIVANAIRHSDPGEEIVIAAGPGPVLTVTDHGCGIAADHLPHVFDRFWRADPSRGRATGGSGLGLAIARQLIRGHGGEITVTSEFGRGSTFTIDFGPDQSESALAAAAPATSISTP